MGDGRERMRDGENEMEAEREDFQCGQGMIKSEDKNRGEDGKVDGWEQIVGQDQKEQE